MPRGWRGGGMARLAESWAMTERTIFLAALDIDDPAERAAYVDRTCGHDAALRHQVEALLT